MNSRITSAGELITNPIHGDHCGHCNMGLCDPREYHPYIACEVYLQKHDSREVWRELWRRIKQRDPDTAGADRLHDLFYPCPDPDLAGDYGAEWKDGEPPQEPA